MFNTMTIKAITEYDYPYLRTFKELPDTAIMPKNCAELEAMTVLLCDYYGAIDDENVMNIRSTILNLVYTTKLYEADGYKLMAEFFAKGSLSFCNYKFK